MKPLLIYSFFIVVSILLSACAPSNIQSQVYTTTAKLPNNEEISPRPDLSKVDGNILVVGKFLEAKTILKVQQGNYFQYTSLIRYEITQSDDRYPYKELTFILNRRGPAGSEIKMKMMKPHFMSGYKAFLLEKDDVSSYYNDYYSIVSYSDI